MTSHSETCFLLPEKENLILTVGWAKPTWKGCPFRRHVRPTLPRAVGRTSAVRRLDGSMFGHDHQFSTTLHRNFDLAEGTTEGWNLHGKPQPSVNDSGETIATTAGGLDTTVARVDPQRNHIQRKRVDDQESPPSPKTMDLQSNGTTPEKRGPIFVVASVEDWNEAMRLGPPSLIDSTSGHPLPSTPASKRRP